MSLSGEKDQTIKSVTFPFFVSEQTFYVRLSAKMSLKGFLMPSCQVLKISGNLDFDYLSKYEFKENVLRGRCQDANVIVKLVFDYQSRCIQLKLKHRRPIVLQFRGIVDTNLKQRFVHFVTMIIIGGIYHQTFACSFRKREKHFVFVKNVLTVWSFFPETLI